MQHLLRFFTLLPLLLGGLLLVGCSTLPTPVPPAPTFTPPAILPTLALPTTMPTNPPAVPTATPVFTAAPTLPPVRPTPVPATPQPSVPSIPLPATRQPIRFSPNAVAYALVANLGVGTPQAYSLNISAGQHMFLTLNGSAWVQVFGPDGRSLTPPTRQAGPWEVIAPQTGDYLIGLKGEGAVTVGIYIRPGGSSSTAAVPLPATAQPIQFQKNAISATLTINLAQEIPQAFTLAAQKGQLMSVRSTGNTTLSFLAPDGSLLPPTLAIPSQWQFALPQMGTNTLVLIGQGTVTLTITVPPGQPTTNKVVPASRTRVNFAPDTATATLNATLVSGSPQGYVLRVLAGQRLYIGATGQAEVQVLGPGDTPLKTLGGVGLWAVDVPQTADYTVVVFGTGATTVTIFVPPL